MSNNNRLTSLPADRRAGAVWRLCQFSAAAEAGVRRGGFGEIEVIGWVVDWMARGGVEERPLHTPSVIGRQASGGGRLTTLPADRLAERAAESLGSTAAAEAGVRSGNFPKKSAWSFCRRLSIKVFWWEDFLQVCGLSQLL